MPPNPPPSPKSHVLYLHGFRSSPRSHKAQRMAQALHAASPRPHWWCPALPASPLEALALVEAGVRGWPREGMAVVGSSLGGFYAHVLASRWACPAVLLNPAVFPARDLAAHIGVHPAWHDPAERIHFAAAHVQQLTELEREAAGQRPPTLAVVAKGDEVLDWREMVAAYGHDQLRLLDGGDHALSDFEAHLPLVMRFLGWP